jgi:itaconyl-CoA hydratase
MSKQTPALSQPDFAAKAVKKPKGHAYEDFAEGQVFQHHWGRTINDGDNSLFSALTLHFNPLYFNAEYANAHGHRSIVVNPLLVFNVVLGLTVEDLSEGGGAFLGVDELKYHATVYPGDTLTASSAVLACRESKSQPDRGIVSWHTQAHNQRGELVLEFRRANFKIKRRS